MTTTDELMGDLDDFPVLDEGVSLADLDAAVRASRSLMAVESRRRAIREAAEREVERIREWAQGADRPLATRAEYLEGLLIHYAMAERDAGRGKTLTTPYARVVTREVKGRWTVSDDALEWARKNRPDLVQTVETIRLAEARRTLRVVDGEAMDPQTGEAVPGVTVEPTRVAASVTVDSKGSGA